MTRLGAFLFLALAAVIAVWGVAALVFSLEPETQAMPAAQHQRPFESDRELRRLSSPVVPKFATEMAAK